MIIEFMHSWLQVMCLIKARKHGADLKPKKGGISLRVLMCMDDLCRCFLGRDTCGLHQSGSSDREASLSRVPRRKLISRNAPLQILTEVRSADFKYVHDSCVSTAQVADWSLPQFV